MMGHHRFSKLPPFPYSAEGETVPVIRRRSPFSRFELCLLVPLTVFATAVSVFTIVYLVQHRGVVKPEAIAALCCTGSLLLVLAYIVSWRLRRPEWQRDVEAGSPQKWQISAPLSLFSNSLPASLPGTRQATFDSKALYTAIPDSRPSPPGKPTLSSKVRLVVKKTFSSSLLSCSSVESSQPQPGRGDSDLLIPQTAEGEHRSSTDSSEDEAGEGLWTSIFELAGDARLEQLRRANLKRLSRESRRSRYEMSGWDASVDKLGEPKIVVTKPEPTASGRSRASWTNASSLRETSLLFDPLRANPVRLSRDPSVRQTKSSQDLPTLLRGNLATPTLRRPRSAEPGFDQSQLRRNQTSVQEGHESNLRSHGSDRLLSSPKPQFRAASPRSAVGRSPRELRKLPSPSDQDLREVFRTGDGL